MKFRIGDKIKFLNDSGIGVIKKISLNSLWIEDEFGFEREYPVSEIIPFQKVEKEKIEVNSLQILNKEAKPQKAKDFIKKKGQTIKEIDLHIGQLVDSMRGLSPHQMLTKQIEVAKIEIEKARAEKIDKLILIHGKGKGVLKEEIYKMLENMADIEFWEANIIKYRFGAVEIRFK